MATVVADYQPIGTATRNNLNEDTRTNKAKLGALAAFLVVGALALISGSKQARNSMINTMGTIKINPFSSINCTEVAVLPFCERNPAILICASCADASTVSMEIQKEIGAIKMNPFSSINCTEIKALPFCTRNPAIMICASCAEGEARKEVAVSAAEVTAVAVSSTAKETVSSSEISSSTMKETVVPAGVESSSAIDKMRPLGAICDFVDDHPLCDAFETTMPCEACECQQLQEEGKCMKPKYMMKCLKCVRKFGLTGQ